MPRFAFVNGRYVRHADACVHIEDRGFQFADGVYEVIWIANGRRVDEAMHLDRLDRSLREIGLDASYPRPVLRAIMDELLRRNRLRSALLYVQITRGHAPREHAFPAAATPTVVMTVRPPRRPSAEAVSHGVQVVTIEDIRWKRSDIKSVALLPNVLGKQMAKRAGAFEAWQIDSDGYVTEGTSTNAWIVADGSKVVTRPADERILDGVTRRTVIRLAESLGLDVEQRPFSLAEAQGAAEAFLTSTSSYVLPVTQIDGAPVGEGTPGPVTRELLTRYEDYVVGGAA